MINLKLKSTIVNCNIKCHLLTLSRKEPILRDLIDVTTSIVPVISRISFRLKHRKYLQIPCWQFYWHVTNGQRNVIFCGHFLRFNIKSISILIIYLFVYSNKSSTLKLPFYRSIDCHIDEQSLCYSGTTSDRVYIFPYWYGNYWQLLEPSRQITVGTLSISCPFRHYRKHIEIDSFQFFSEILSAWITVLIKCGSKQ